MLKDFWKYVSEFLGLITTYFIRIITYFSVIVTRFFLDIPLLHLSIGPHVQLNPESMVRTWVKKTFLWLPWVSYERLANWGTSNTGPICSTLTVPLLPLLKLYLHLFFCYRCQRPSPRSNIWLALTFCSPNWLLLSWWLKLSISVSYIYNLWYSGVSYCCKYW